MKTTTKQATALRVLVDHCSETHPHFESARGQMDIAAALQEHAALLAVAEAAKRALELTKPAYNPSESPIVELCRTESQWTHNQLKTALANLASLNQ